MDEETRPKYRNPGAITLETIPNVFCEDDQERALLLDAKKGLTKEEAEILAVMRRIRSEALPVKERIATLRKRIEEEMERPAGRNETLRHRLNSEEIRLEELRREWDHWKEKRDAARHRRMVLLGHEE
ncbi:MAG: hypothetical protein HY788_17105 [Deltaproteobacteria bacterium]|nr:hypothetical protein [Deltaproteobacteria bacterium]